METPEQPTISTSEPVVEKKVLEKTMKMVEEDEFDGIQVELQYVLEYLSEYGLGIDENGFVIHTDTQEFAVPAVFDSELVKKTVMQDGESVFDCFFRPVTDESVIETRDAKVHLSNLHSVILTSDGVSYPVRDDTVMIREFHSTLQTGFRFVMGWSDGLELEKKGEESTWLVLGRPSSEPLKLNCLNLSCEFRGSLSQWDGDTSTCPTCPECGLPWDTDRITVCVLCCEWHPGLNLEGEGMHSGPACPECGIGNRYLEEVSRGSSYSEYWSVVAENRPSHRVKAVDDDGHDTSILSYHESKEEAENNKSNLQDIMSGDKTYTVESLNPIEKVNRHNANRE